jgi:hypothetical protein
VACEENRLALLLGAVVIGMALGLKGDGVRTDRIDSGVEASDRICLVGVETAGGWMSSS